MTRAGSQGAMDTTRLADRLHGAYVGRAHVREGKPLAAGTHSLPEPDIAVVRGDVGAYAERHPTGADALLVVELAWFSQEEDRRKAHVYAAAGVFVYWLVDLAARKLELRVKPEAGAYRVVEILGEDDVIPLPKLGEEWSVRDLLP